MPPEAKFTKWQIVDVAFEMVRKNGLDCLTARALGEQLGSSARPIFTVFQNMEEVRQEVCKAAAALYKSYVEKGLAETLAFKGVGTQYIMFAKNEPKLFQLLFMQKQRNIPNLQNVLAKIDESYPAILASVQNSYAVDSDMAKLLYQHLWIYSHGIATLCATDMCTFTAEEISNMMTQVFVGLLKNLKSEIKDD